MFNTGYELILAGICAAMSAQLMKFIGYMIRFKKVNFSVLFTTGGMPSSHSATVCALTTASLIKYGVGSFEFAICAILAFITMYDAMGVRRETGNQAKVLNEMIEAFAKMSDKSLSNDDKLKEFIGHTPLQVFVGAILGIVLAIAICAGYGLI